MVLNYGFVVAAMLCCLLGCAQDEPGSTTPPVRTEVDLEKLPSGVVDLDGLAFDLGVQTPARAIVVLFTRSDCPISNRCAPAIARLCDVFQRRGVDFYLVYVDPRETPESIRRHLQEYEYPCQALRDPRHALVAYCQATTTPEAVVFDRDRKITYQGRINDQYADVGRARPEPTTHELADAIESTILGRPVATPRTKPVGCPIADLHN